MNIIKLSKETNKEDSDIDEDIILDALRAYTEEVDQSWNYITPPELKDQGLDNFYILDIRKEKDFKEGHLPGAHNIFWLELLDDKNLEKLPKDKKILLVCYVGHTTSQMMVALKLLGYDVMALKFGMGKSPVEGVPVAGWLDYGFETVKSSRSSKITLVSALDKMDKYKVPFIKDEDWVYQDVYKGFYIYSTNGYYFANSFIVPYKIIGNNGKIYYPKFEILTEPSSEVIKLPKMWIDLVSEDGKNDKTLIWDSSLLHNLILEKIKEKQDSIGTPFEYKGYFIKPIQADNYVKFKIFTDSGYEIHNELRTNNWETNTKGIELRNELPKLWIDAGFPEQKYNETGFDWDVNSLKQYIANTKKMKDEAFGSDPEELEEKSKNLASTGKTQIVKISGDINMGVPVNTGMESQQIAPTPEQQQAIEAEYKADEETSHGFSSMQNYKEYLRKNPKVKNSLNQAIQKMKHDFPQMAQDMSNPTYKTTLMKIVDQMAAAPSSKSNLGSMITNVQKVTDKQIKMVPNKAAPTATPKPSPTPVKIPSSSTLPSRSQGPKK